MAKAALLIPGHPREECLPGAIIAYRSRHERQRVFQECFCRGLSERLHTGRLGCERNLRERRSPKCMVLLVGRPERPSYQPRLAIQAHFRANSTQGHFFENGAPLGFRSKGILSQAVAYQAAESCLPAAMTDLP